MKDNIITRNVARQALRAAIKDPDTNIPKMIDLVEKFDRKGINKKAYNNLRNSLNNPEDKPELEI